MPWLITLMQLCELPFMPVLPSWYIGMISVWLFGSIFFLTILPLQTLYQAIPIFSILFLCLPARIFHLVASSIDSVPYPYLSVYVILGLVVCIHNTIDVIGTRQNAFNQVNVAKKECDQFRDLLSSFPEGIMIWRHSGNDESSARNKSCDESSMKMNQSSVSEEQSSMNGMNNHHRPSSQSSSAKAKPNVLFMN